MIRYTDGTIKDLTRVANFGNTGQQGSGSIAVRDPQVSWDGTRALFSMVIGAPESAVRIRDFSTIQLLYQVIPLSKT